MPKIVVWADAQRGEALKPLAEAWGAANGVTVEVVAYKDKLLDTYKTATEAGTGPDLVIWAHDVIGDLLRNGFIQPMQIADPSLFDPVAVRAMTLDGQTYGVPYSVENIGLIRNTDLAPEAPATMEDLVAAGQKLISDKKGKNIMALQVGATGDAYHIYPLFVSGGGSYFGLAADGVSPDPKNVTVDSAESIAAGEKLYELGEKGVKALTRSIDGNNAIPTFTDKKTAFLVSGPWAIAQIKTAGVPYDITPVPQFKDGAIAGPFVGVNGIYLSSKTKNQVLAEEFANALIGSEEAQLALYAADPRRPALLSAVAKVAASDPDVAKWQAAGKDGTPMPAIPEMGQIWAPYGAAEAAIVGGADPAKTLKEAAKAIRDAIAGM
jgi:arabinogalactan oligomer/maltooligosaccharide transport system substrate-binding protein